MAAALPAPLRRTVTPDEARRELARRWATEKLEDFVRLAWPVLNPGTPLIWNWHMSAICEHLEAATRGDIKRLVINVPPGHSKTTIVSVCWPTWVWLSNPQTRWIFGAYDLDLSVRDSVNRRTLIESPFYQGVMRPAWAIEKGERHKKRFVNDARGSMRAVSVGSGVLGDHADFLVVDDPIKREDLHGPKLKGHVEWFQQTLSTRVRDISKACFVVIMQRLHELDLSGVLLKAGRYEHVCLPAEYEPKLHSRTSVGWEDPRTVPGELLFPERFPAEALAEKRTQLGEAQYAAQYGQTPTAGDGNVFRRGWWRRWRALPAQGTWLGSVDATFKDSDTSDFVVFQVWFKSGANAYLVDQVRARMSFTESKHALRDFAARWPLVARWLIEAKANGEALMSELKDIIPGLIPTYPERIGGKVARAAACAPWVEAGNVYVPAPDAQRPLGLAPGAAWEVPAWVSEYVEEHAAFPRAANDDQVDGTSQALNDMRTQFDASLLEGVGGVSGGGDDPRAGAPAFYEAVFGDR